MIDFRLSNNNLDQDQSNIDFNFNDAGDIITINSFETSIVFALFANRDKEIILDKDSGSYLYKLDQSRLVSSTLNMYRFYANEAMQYLYNAKYVVDIDTSVKQISNSKLGLNIKLVSVNKDEVFEYFFKL